MTIGILPVGRATFDVPYAEERLAKILDRIAALGEPTVGPRYLLMDGEAARSAISDIVSAGAERLLILQVTFTDAIIVVEAAETGLPLSIWALPEPRAGGRLRLNSFCGLNLAGHALGLRGIDFNWVLSAPEDMDAARMKRLLSAPEAQGGPAARLFDGDVQDEARRVAGAVSGKRIACIGTHPDGFDTCAYDADRLSRLAGVSVDAIPLDDLFAEARVVEAGQVAELRASAADRVTGLDAVDQVELDRSLRLRVALDGIFERGDYGAAAIRCWPETFTEYGGAVCGPAAMMAEAKRPCACEADVYGALTQMILQEAAGAPVFLTDLVDVDVADDSAVVWHCGQAPLSMCDPEATAEATIHTNRKMPLLYQFPLKPGPVTLMRVSQARGETKMVLAGAEMLRRPMAFTGTSGVLRFERPAGAVLADLMACGLEHHMAIAYGDHRPLLRQVAGAMGLPVLDL
ncbi:hypothetical protein GQ651_10845 [Alphaproteobacteria bacterium GH1-50]|uniref:L-fucose isomerase C-terminal domain-containing protein n=1 Tax=Kangsaoukella pontilimi TaxID=2691042 RepID=A0A7C9IIG1_9RHOB|nr:hypothetical protein [Kangsaoukella pontilimi]MXQ08342.1 hypothetical protein [Kangsaoukella pontilimi]